MTEEKKIWYCKIGEANGEKLPMGADAPMRQAIQQAYKFLTGKWPDFCFSGWAAELTGSLDGEWRELKTSAVRNPPGHLMVGTNEQREVVVNLDHDRTGHIVFSQQQARDFAELLLRKAHEALLDSALEPTRRE